MSMGCPLKARSCLDFERHSVACYSIETAELLLMENLAEVEARRSRAGKFLEAKKPGGENPRWRKNPVARILGGEKTRWRKSSVAKKLGGETTVAKWVVAKLRRRTGMYRNTGPRGALKEGENGRNWCRYT